MKLRRMVNEPDSTTYTDSDIADYIEAYPLMDERGEVPYTWDTSTDPPSQDDNDDWIATFDLHAAAADIWEEKAAIVAVDFDFRADGGNYSRSQVYEAYMKQARYHRSRRTPQTHHGVMYPDPGASEDASSSWVINMPEDEWDG